MAVRSGNFRRTTFADWAKEILEMKTRLGIEHIGVGTDGGGHLPMHIDGYRDVRDLEKLARAMLDVGLSRDDINAVMGGNIYRVLQACIGYPSLRNERLRKEILR